MPEAPSEYGSTQKYGSKYLNCGPSTSDGAGTVVISTIHYSYYMWEFDGFDSGGNHSSTGFYTDTFEPYGQAGGFLSFSLNNQYHLSYLDSRTWQFTHYPPEPHDPVKVTADPRGGLRALFTDGMLKAYGPTGETLWSISPNLSGPVQAMGVDAQGHTLLVTHGPSDENGDGTEWVQALWVDAAGQPGTPFLAQVQAPVYAYELVPQAGQGLFLGIKNGATKTWTAFAPLETHSSPAPAWLSGDAERPLIRLPGGKGYLRWGTPIACQHEAEILSASGTSCGKTRFPAPPPHNSWQSTCGSMSVGPDGTIVETLPRDYYVADPEDSSSVYYFCPVRWWPALFKPLAPPPSSAPPACETAGGERSACR
ncbi:hypothetical protein [Hyalangium versicolor]|uniref:hypothetical protein n=1 Tax=Hyalangium versicolor TaxID=2861190 RepID=UPI001CCB78D7|nr:hypothetical protein [Hyalangium versicolor]